MQCKYIPFNGILLPFIPIAIQNNGKRLRIEALVDTGATHTVLPMEMAAELGIVVDLEKQIESDIAGGGQCLVYPSPHRIEYVFRDTEIGKEFRWKGSVFFALGQKLALLGHHQCLERLNLTFLGNKRMLEVEWAS